MRVGNIHELQALVARNTFRAFLSMSHRFVARFLWERLARVFLVSQRWLVVDVLLAVFSLVAVLADPVTSLVPLRVSQWQSTPVGLASVRDAVPQHPLRRLSRGETGSVRAGRGSSDDFPP